VSGSSSTRVLRRHPQEPDRIGRHAHCTLPDGEYENSDPWNRLLRNAVNPLLMPVEVAEVALVDVRPDLKTKELRWTAVRWPILLAG